ncbi:MAG TPA: serine O-acetyltransferase [Chthoniobacterales bacterium]|nr:serine O-acetyltransferase [Chthoniobacterales bacterium]
MNAFSKRLLASIGAFQYHRARNGPWHKGMRRIARVRHMFWSIVTQSDIGLEARLGRGLMLPHPNGIVIHEDARIGDDCMIMQQVTVGMIDDGEVPTIGNRVYIGAGAKIIGKVLIGDGARIGANAVVMSDVPPNCTAVGVPARIIKRSVARDSKPLVD